MIQHKQNRDRNDIFAKPVLKTIFKNQTFIRFIQLVTLGLFIYGVYMGFKEPTPKNHFTTELFWGLFWSLFIVVTLVSSGRIFCGICPHGFLGKYITKYGLKKEMPQWMQNRFIGVFILFFGWWAVYYAAPTFWKIPLATAWMFSALTLFAFLIYFVYKDMAYCKYMCPIGTMMRSYAKIGPTWLSTYKEDCGECKTFDCAKACPYNLKPFTFDKKNSMEDCTLCMDCASSCDSVKFSIIPPSKSLFSKFKTLKAEVWAFILITAAIPMTMGLHHGLNRSNASDSFIWTQTAHFFEQYIDFGSLDSVGIFSFIYAVLASVGIVYIGMYIASKILKAPFEKTFYTLGYAFAPLFIIGGLAHLISAFATHNYADIVNGFIYGFGLSVDEVENLATRRDAWLGYLKVIPYIAVIWGYLILANRLKLFEASRLQKIGAFIFASSLITLYLALQLYKVYIFNEYGRAKGGHNHGAKKEMFQTVPFKDATLLQSGQNKTTGIVCGMKLPMFYKTNHSATLDGKVRQYCSIHCLVEDLKIKKLSLKNLQVVDVKSLKFIDAKSAYYVAGSKKPATMSRVSKYGFKDLDDAKNFTKRYGGKIVSFDEALEIALKDFYK